MVYEFQNSLKDDFIRTIKGGSFNSPPHLHNSFEFIKITGGKMIIKIDRAAYELKNGDCLLIFPNQIHEFINVSDSEYFICIFSPSLVNAFNKAYVSKIPVSNRFSPSESTLSLIMSEKFACPDSENKNILRIKSALYALCADFDEEAIYTPRREDEHLISKIFGFVEENFKEKCTLEALSAHTGYHYVYISRFFRQYTGLTFIDYVNRYRIYEACRILKNSNQSILQTAYDCGFDSLRTFNRVFKKLSGKTPTEWRKELPQIP